MTEKSPKRRTIKKKPDKVVPFPVFGWRARGRCRVEGTAKGGRWPAVMLERMDYYDEDEEWDVRFHWGWEATQNLPDDLGDEKNLPPLPKDCKAESRQAAKDMANDLLRKAVKGIAPWHEKVEKHEQKRQRAWQRKHNKRKKEEARCEGLKDRIAECYPELGEFYMDSNHRVRIDIDVLTKLLGRLGMPSESSYCLACGSDDVEQALWTVLKNGVVNDSEGFGSHGNGGVFCPTCDSNDIRIVGAARRPATA